MPRDPLHDAIYLGIETAIEENYRGADGSYPVSPTAVATLASLAALAAIEEHGYAIVPAVPPQALEALQDAQTSGDGITGPIANADSSTGLSEPQPWKGSAVVLIDGQQIPIRADLTIQPAAWSVDAHLDPADELYLPLGSCVIRLPDGRQGAAIVTSVQNGVCGSLSGVGPPPTSKPVPIAKEVEAALSRVVKLAHDLAADQLVAADNIAAAILHLDQRDLHPGDAIAALTKENHRDA